ncbi:MAG: hypothetical protein ACLSFA_14210 [Roseburia inulinivorans]
MPEKAASSPSSLVKMEEKSHDAWNVRWHDCDMPGGTFVMKLRKAESEMLPTWVAVGVLVPGAFWAWLE